MVPFCEDLRFDPGMDVDPAALPDNIEALKAALLAAVARADAAQTEAAVARAEQSDAHALIVHLKLQIEKLKREIYGQHSERSTRLLDRMELQLEESEAAATTTTVAAVPPQAQFA
jgi:transposase